MNKTAYEKVITYIELLNLDQSTEKIGSKLYYAKLPIFSLIKNNPDVVDGGGTGLKLFKHDEAVSGLKYTYEDNDDISEENNRIFEREIRDLENDKHKYFIFNSCDGSYKPLNRKNLRTFLLYVISYAHREYLGTNTVALNNILDNVISA